MIGGELAECHLTPRQPERSVLELESPVAADVDPFGTDTEGHQPAVGSGEIFGIAGVSGNGQKELLAALSGEQLSAKRDQ